MTTSKKLARINASVDKNPMCFASLENELNNELSSMGLKNEIEDYVVDELGRDFWDNMIKCLAAKHLSDEQITVICPYTE